ncbi:DUF2505 domain-containing protein [Luteipulveratus halotolerans]|uniref:DUF2505 domain-containing protein n=1 Tax=Luteipulveratus halotolerans TaxID=1631356 RepID=A0A0L6CJL5_9MICO|nr:DUF2505 domain-containing protein [Luteipulveratus halotolerans]KNX37708.1 hypothetical protein VV01_12035 [Luteipulveratus halotolerans]
MKISVDWTYTAAPDEVWAMTSSTEFQDRKCADAGAQSYDSSVTADGDRTVIVTTREMATEGVPDALRSLAGRTVTITETQTWGPAAADGSREAEVRVEAKGQPVSMNGKVRMAPAADSTAVSLTGDLKARVPLVGGRIEKAVAPVIEAAARSEAEVGEEWLAG